MGYTVVDAKDVEPRNGVFRQIRRTLGVTAFGINQIDLPPGAEGFEHDESSSGQEEVYVFLGGRGVMHVQGEEIDVYPGRFVFVEPGTSRKPVAGPDGLSWVCIGSVPGAAYAQRDPF
jgi:mannose-6-phosphate isomerase-like protein (cupin superfamily)